MLKKLYELKKLHEKKGKKGFSMIELIIVIAIMAILVALIGTQLIPYLEKSRVSRDKTTLDTCKSALESVLADKEYTPTTGGTISEILSAAQSGGITTTDTAQQLFESYAGIAPSDDKIFRSQYAKGKAANDVTVTITSGVIANLSVNNTNDAKNAVSIEAKASASAAPQAPNGGGN